MGTDSPTDSQVEKELEELRTKESYLRAINQFALTLIDITNVEDLVWHVAKEVVGRLDFVDCVIYLFDDERDMLVQRAAIGEKNPEKHVILNRLEIPIGSAITGTVAKTREPILVDNLQEDPRYLADINSACSEICVPLIYDDKILGVIDSEHPEPNYFSENHLDVLKAIAAMTSGKIEQCKIQSRRRAQSEIIQQVSEAVMLVREGGRIIGCNMAAEALLERDSELLIGANIREFLSDSIDAEQLVLKMRATMEHKGRWKGRIAIRQKNGHDVMTEVSLTQQIDSDETLPVYIAVIRDISEQVENERLERELQQSQKMESLGQLTGGIAHDFNNLLGIISGYSDLAMHYTSELEEERLTKYISQIQDASRRATNLVSQMLSFSRSQAVDKRPVQLARLIQDDTNMIRATLPSTIDLIVEIEPDLPRVIINSTQVHQILMNLSINARDAMSGQGQLTIGLGWVQDMDAESTIAHKPVEGDWLELSVADTGCGIDKENIHKIFNPFYTTKDVGKGTGMGLSVIYKIMEAHGGHILVDSVPGQGSTFRLLFAPTNEPIGKGKSEDSSVSSDASVGDGSHVLIVDDEASLAEFMAQTLEHVGYQATAIADSEEALNLFKAEPDKFQILITDQTMPKLTGLQLIDAIHELQPELPVILCTGYSDQVDGKSAQEQGIPYFEKPVELEKLFESMKTLLS